jgi:hypothetical protein
MNYVVHSFATMKHYMPLLWRIITCLNLLTPAKCSLHQFVDPFLPEGEMVTSLTQQKELIANAHCQLSYQPVTAYFKSNSPKPINIQY